MTQENFKPIAIQAPSDNPLLFRVRCLIDLQLATISKPLRLEMSALKGRVLDIGAGESPWREWLPSTSQYFGLDVQNAEEYGMQSKPDITFYDGKIIPFETASFDAAICIEVLEHVERPEQIINEIARILCDGATLILTVPWSARRHHIPHDYHRFTRERLLQLFSENGFENIEVSERGNDISSIASKFVVLAVRLVKPKRISQTLWAYPLLILVAPITIGMLLAAHCSIFFGLGAPEDPLGYFIKAKRISRQR